MEWFDIPSASIEYVSASKRTFETWIKYEGLRYVKVRGKRLIKREWIDEFLERHEVSNRNELESIVNEVMKDI